MNKQWSHLDRQKKTCPSKHALFFHMKYLVILQSTPLWSSLVFWIRYDYPNDQWHTQNELYFYPCVHAYGHRQKWIVLFINNDMQNPMACRIFPEPIILHSLPLFDICVRSYNSTLGVLRNVGIHVPVGVYGLSWDNAITQRMLWT